MASSHLIAFVLVVEVAAVQGRDGRSLVRQHTGARAATKDIADAVIAEDAPASRQSPVGVEQPHLARPVAMSINAQGEAYREAGEAQWHYKEDFELEAALDAMSWELLAPPNHTAIRAHAPEVALAAIAHGTSSQTAAGARLASWMQAVERSQSFSENDDAHVLPPGCPSSVPASDQYWAQVDHYSTDANVCRYSNNCTTPYTNLERINAIRKTLSVTHKFMDKLDVQHGLFGGSLIGASRCQDVLPWDKDSDVFVVQEDIHKVLTLFDGVGKDGSADYRGDWEMAKRKLDLGAFGDEFEGFVLVEKMPGCMPFMIVDTSTGFFTDVFPLRAVGSHALVPLVTADKTGTVECDAEKLFNGCLLHECHQWTLENTLPPSKCQIGDSSLACPAKPYPWLAEQFGVNVLTNPIHKTRIGTK